MGKLTSTLHKRGIEEKFSFRICKDLHSLINQLEKEADHC